MNTPLRNARRRLAGFTLLLLAFGAPAVAQMPDSAGPGPSDDASEAPPLPKPRHVILITIDSLRADRIGVYGHESASTPVMDALADESLRFERALAHASMAAPSIASLMTGVLPVEHGVYDDIDVLAPPPTTLASLLRDEGFRTGAFVGNSLLGPERGLGRGFEHETKDFAVREGSRGRPENSAEQVNGAALSWLAQRTSDERIFLWVHYQEPHGPYEPPGYVATPSDDVDPMDRVLSESTSNSGRGAIPAYQWVGHGRRSEYEARYDAEISEVDRHLGALLEAVRERGMLAQSLVILTADHGEAFGEEDLHCAHGEGLSDALLRVPLIVRLEGVPSRLRTERVTLIDVVPTVASLLELETPKLAGHSLFENRGDRPFVAQVGRQPTASWRRAIRGNHEIRDVRGGERLDLGFDVEPDGRLSKLGESQLTRMLRFMSRNAPWPRERSGEVIEPHRR